MSPHPAHLIISSKPYSFSETLIKPCKTNILTIRSGAKILLFQACHMAPSGFLREGPAENLIKPVVFGGAPLDPEQIQRARGSSLSRHLQNLIVSPNPLENIANENSCGVAQGQNFLMNLNCHWMHWDAPWNPCKNHRKTLCFRRGPKSERAPVPHKGGVPGIPKALKKGNTF